MSKVEHKASIVAEPAPTARFATKRAGSKPVKAVRGKQVSGQLKPSENFERIGKGKDVVFSGAWKPGRVLSSKP